MKQENTNSLKLTTKRHQLTKKLTKPNPGTMDLNFPLLTLKELQKKLCRVKNIK